jgi:hypothetical protein
MQKSFGLNFYGGREQQLLQPLLAHSTQLKTLKTVVVCFTIQLNCMQQHLNSRPVPFMMYISLAYEVDAARLKTSFKFALEVHELSRKDCLMA